MTTTSYRRPTTSRVDVLLGREERQILEKVQEHLRTQGIKMSLASVLRLALYKLAQQEGIND
jgi:hypothetical protein